MTEDIVHEATYPYPPAEVWRVLTTGSAIGAWLMETDFAEARVGHRFTFKDKPRVGWSGVTECEVLEVVPERRLVYSFAAAEDKTTPTKVEWDLTPTADGTRLRLRHSGFTGFKGWMMRMGMNNGWGGIVRGGIPYVVERSRAGVTPTREETRDALRRAMREGALPPRARS